MCEKFLEDGERLRDGKGSEKSLSLTIEYSSTDKVDMGIFFKLTDKDFLNLAASHGMWLLTIQLLVLNL